MVEELLIDAKWVGSINLSDDAKTILGKYKRIAIFSSVNFLHRINEVVSQLVEMNSEVIISDAHRASCKGQILGCDSYKDSFEKEVFEAHAFLYIGDGMFHPDALLLSQIYSENKIPVFVWNPKINLLEEISSNRIIDKAKKIKSNLLRFISSENIGILVSTKYGQENLSLVLKLKSKLNDEGKSAYIFLGDTLDVEKSEDFNFIDCWVNSACPRIGQDDCINILKPLVNIKEAFDAEKYLSKIRF